jgi:DNA-binding transcriptional regulator YbjK
MVDKTEMDEKLEQLDREWRRRFEDRDAQWRNSSQELGARMCAMITLVCNAMNLVDDANTADEMEHMVKTGLARLNAIYKAADAEREPGAQLN